MVDSLEDVRKRISDKYLGMAGIHAVGALRGEGAIVLYVEPDQCVDVPAGIAEEVQPYTLKITKSPRASMI